MGELPDWLRERLLSESKNKKLTEEALSYLRLVKRGGRLRVEERLPSLRNHPLLFEVVALLKRAEELLSEGEENGSGDDEEGARQLEEGKAFPQKEDGKEEGKEGSGGS